MMWTPPRKDLDTSIKLVPVTERVHIRLWLAKARYGCRTFAVLIDRALDALEDRYPPR